MEEVKPGILSHYFRIRSFQLPRQASESCYICQLCLHHLSALAMISASSSLARPFHATSLSAFDIMVGSSWLPLSVPPSPLQSCLPECEAPHDHRKMVCALTFPIWFCPKCLSRALLMSLSSVVLSRSRTSTLMLVSFGLSSASLRISIRTSPSASSSMVLLLLSPGDSW